MPHFCDCGCGGDTYLCQECAGVFCCRKPPTRLPVPRTGFGLVGNMCPACVAKHGGAVGIQVAKLLQARGQVWPDSADMGVVINDPDMPEACTMIRNAMRALVRGPGWVLHSKWVAPDGQRNESWEWRYTAGPRVVAVTFCACKGREILDYEIL